MRMPVSEQQGAAQAARRPGLASRLWFRPYIRPHTDFEVTTPDGVPLRGVHLQGRHDTLVIYCHGFLASKNYTVVPRFVEMLAEDVDAIAFDFRGHGESGGECTLGDREVLDAGAIMDYARGLNYRRIWFVGSSMGGAVAIRFAAAAPDVAGVATIGAFAQRAFSPIGAASVGLLGYPLARRAVGAARGCRIESVCNRPAPLDVVHDISPRPALFIHGEFDPLIPVSHARALAAAAGEPKKLIVIPHGNHDLPNLNRRTKGWIVDWFRSHDTDGKI